METNEILYQEALDFLYSFVDYSLTRSFRYSPDKFDLGRMVMLLAGMGNPHQNFAVIHVAGTKGKGSIAAMIANVLRFSGYCTGLYTSPHLEDFCERIQVNGEKISHTELAIGVQRLKPHAAKVEHLTTFELTTALAFDYFSRLEVEIAVIEVGLGGRLDATNVVTPLVSVISSISYDHMNVLGHTLSEIAGEKAGIIKTRKPVVLAPQPEEARDMLVRVAGAHNSPTIQVGLDVGYQAAGHSLDSQCLVVFPQANQPEIADLLNQGGRTAEKPLGLEIPLLGLHQVENAATAFAALQVVRSAGWEINSDDLRRGFASVKWPGRFELLQKNPVIIIDSAHNRDSALRLCQALDDYFPKKPVILLFGASEDKDVSGMLAELGPRVRWMIATQSIHPRAMGMDKLVELARANQIPVEGISPVEDAFVKARNMASGNGVLLATGSLFIAAAIRTAMHKKEQEYQSGFSPITTVLDGR